MKKKVILIIAVLIITVILVFDAFVNEWTYKNQIVVPADSPELPSRGFYKGFLPIPSEEQSFDEVYQESTHTVEFVPVWGKPTPFYELAEVLNGSWARSSLKIS